MILRGTEIHRGEHGKCGLLSIRILSRNIAELSVTGVLGNIGTSLCDPEVSLSFQTGR